MPADIKIIHTKEFIRATPDGILNLEETKKLFLDIVSVSEKNHKYNIVIDARNAEFIMSAIDLWYLMAEMFKNYNAFSQKMVILYLAGHFDNVEFFELCSQNKGFSVNAFTSYEEAIEWLFEV